MTQTSLIVRFLCGFWHALTRSYKSSGCARILRKAGDVVQSAAHGSHTIGGLNGLIRRFTLDPSAESSVFLRAVNAVVNGICRFFAAIYTWAARCVKGGLADAFYRHLLRPVDGFFSAFYALSLIASGYLTVVVAKNLILMRFGLRFVAACVLLIVALLIVAAGSKLRAAMQRSLFVHLVRGLLE